ncbi:replication initiator protein A [Clostridium tarantellae]|uniref:Replication initiator protein A n=1 Tax=Clostridium tarantellae TaxID=39493 RepID=A0A6I1MTU1_9CLOT|nr:replication initiator protein A [Clostridium tarantellae]MPQ44291.1 hypothetical protein [Clostridium tarantellae]
MEKEIIIKEGSKRISESSFLIDVNMIEAPLFIFKPRNKTNTATHWIESPDVSPLAKRIIGRVRNPDITQVEYMRWTDSKGNDREIIATSITNLPNGFAMDVLFTLIALYIKKSPPIIYDKKIKKYVLPTRKLNCSLTEVCLYMGITDSGQNINRIKDAIFELFSVSYHPLTQGIIYDKNNEEFVESEMGIRLLSYEFLSKAQQNKRNSQSLVVTFDDLILNNIENSFIKFLSNNTYFSLRSGLTRRLYSYVEGNRYSSNGQMTYIKRRYNTLKYKLPIEYRNISDLKRKLKNPLERLIEKGVLEDYFYGDEILINGIKEDAIYIIFKGNRSKVINSLTKSVNKNNKIVTKKEKPKEQMVFPNDIKKELKDFGINENKISELMSKNSKYELAKYILWIKDGISKGKVKDSAALFVFAMTPAGENNGNMVKVENSNPEIVKFVEDYKAKIEGEKFIDEGLIRKTFDEYIENELSKFIKEEEFVYMAMKDSILGDIEGMYKKKLKGQRQLYNIASSQEEKDKILKTIEKWERYPIEKEKSEIFKDELLKRASIYRGFKIFESFKIEYIKKNN